MIWSLRRVKIVVSLTSLPKEVTIGTCWWSVLCKIYFTKEKKWETSVQTLIILFCSSLLEINSRYLFLQGRLTLEWFMNLWKATTKRQVDLLNAGLETYNRWPARTQDERASRKGAARRYWRDWWPNTCKNNHILNPLRLTLWKMQRNACVIFRKRHSQHQIRKGTYIPTRLRGCAVLYHSC